MISSNGPAALPSDPHFVLSAVAKILCHLPMIDFWLERDVLLLGGCWLSGCYQLSEIRMLLDHLLNKAQQVLPAELL